MSPQRHYLKRRLFEILRTLVYSARRRVAAHRHAGRPGAAPLQGPRTSRAVPHNRVATEDEQGPIGPQQEGRRPYSLKAPAPGPSDQTADVPQRPWVGVGDSAYSPDLSPPEDPRSERGHDSAPPPATSLVDQPGGVYPTQPSSAAVGPGLPSGGQLAVPGSAYCGDDEGTIGEQQNHLASQDVDEGACSAVEETGPADEDTALQSVPSPVKDALSERSDGTASEPASEGSLKAASGPVSHDDQTEADRGPSVSQKTSSLNAAQPEGNNGGDPQPDPDSARSAPSEGSSSEGYPTAAGKPPATSHGEFRGGAKAEKAVDPKRRRTPSPLPPRTSPETRVPARPSAAFELSDPYVRWNRLLAEQCLLGESVEARPAYLSVTPRILAAALQAGQGVTLTEEDAALDFVAAVSSTYHRCVLPEPDKLWVLSRPTADDLPGSIAFLGASVLAAYEMHTAEGAGPNAYYPRLASLLKCELAGGVPIGFEQEDFADLWEMLSRWLQTASNRRLALPGPDAGLRRFVAYPLCHVPLRKLDVEKLPEFFYASGLEPGSRIPPDEMYDGFLHWAATRSILSRAGEAALSDDRRDAVAAQVASELEAWDGSSTDSQGCRTAAVHLLLDVIRRRPSLEFLARRPASFPERFDIGSRLFEAGEQGWYDPVPITEADGDLLAHGITWTCRTPEGAFVLHRPPSRAIALRATSEHSGFISQRGLPLGISGAVLCLTDEAARVAEFLSEASGQRCRPVDDPGLPHGWSLFTGIVPRHAVPSPTGLDCLEIQSDASIVLQGGLRLGRRAAWLAGAPPDVLIAGPPDIEVILDGSRVSLSNGAVAKTEDLGVGEHVVKAGTSRRRFEIVEPELMLNGSITTDRATFSVALPQGRWCVLGATPGEIAVANSPGEGGLVTTHFVPVWGVSLGARRGASVLALTEHPPCPRPVRAAASRPAPALYSWVSTVYDAHIRRPRLGTVWSGADGAELRGTWSLYVKTAKTNKRQWRRRR